MRIIGAFLFCTGVALFISKRKRDRGEKTWEEDHGITVKTWHIVVCIILGVAISFGATLYSNMQEFSEKQLPGTAITTNIE